MRERGLTIALAIICVLSSTIGFGQDSKQLFQIGQDTQVICASDIIHERMMNEDSKYRESFEKNERMMNAARVKGGAAKSMIIHTIPVVVHVMHTGESIGEGVNISDAQVQSAIDGLNEDYRKMPGTNGDGAGVDIEVEFCLASRDPNGNPTDGINRVNASGLANYATEGITAGQGSGANETELKAMSKWDRDDYYNIWIVNEIEDNDGGSGIQGYAYFPNSSAARDGAVILFNAFGTTGNLKFYTNMNRTTTHELGHAFFLYHTFQGNSCSETNCDTQGDRVCDTPPTVSSTSCNNPACGGTQLVENYMDYTSQTCMDMFTQGQKDRMRDAIEIMRPSLLNSLGCTPPNSLDAGVTSINAPTGYSCSTSVTPEVEVSNFGSSTLTSLQLKYRLDGGSLQTYQFTGNIPTGETETIMLPTISAAIGAHSLEVYSDSPNGGTDGFQSNDSATQEFEVVDGSNVTVAIAVDNYGGETTWDIQTTGGDVIASGGPYPNNMYGTTYETSVCLSEDCFEFNIYDSYGDGICCGAGFGGYSITDAGGNEIIVNGDDFTYTENRPFCTSIVEVLPEADFSASQTIICEGSTVQLTDQSTGSPSSWSWSFPGGSPSASNQQHPVVTYPTSGPKNVTLTVTNDNGSDSQTANAFINVGGSIGVSGTSAPTSCYNSSDGSINVSITGGTTPYTYSWSHGPSSQDVSGLSPGPYVINVEDAAGCTAIETFSVTSPSQLILSTSTEAASCGSPGSATVNATGGSPGYSYLWNDAQEQTTATADGLSGGTYSVTVTDSEACQATAVVNVSSGGDVEVSVVNQVNVSCNGSSDGSATIAVSGGESPYEYDWAQFPGITGNSVNNLSAGTYSVTVTDQNACEASISFTIIEAEAMSAIANSLTNVSCNGGSDGSISITVQGGQSPYSYSWNGAGFGATTTPSGVSAGTYDFTVTDANGCQAETVVTLTEPSALIVTLDATNATCYGAADGTLLASISGGTAPYSFNWNGAGLGQIMNPQGVAAGFYTFRVTDSNGCEMNATASIFEPSAIDLSQSSSTMASCLNDGTASVSPTGGAEGFSYLWSDPQMQTTATATELAGGSYTVVVTDANGCQNAKQITVESSSDLNLDNGSKSNATCAGYGDGSATVEAEGGDGTYSYQWNDPAQQTGPVANNLVAGVYSVTVTDGAGCQSNRSFNINEPDPIGSTIFELVHDSCGLNVGKVVLGATGGTGTKSFLWDDAGATTGSSLAGVSFGIYTAEITDENQCQGLRTVEIEDLDCVGTTGIEELNKIEINMSVYPNPVSGLDFTIAIETTMNEPLDMFLMDITGKTILVDQLSPGVESHRVLLDGNEAEGIYMLQLSNGTITTTKRIVIIR
jgi:PKD repeat protein